MSITVESVDDDGVALLTSSDDLNAFVLENSSDGFKKLLGDDWAKKKVVFDMSEATYIDSAAIGWLISLSKGFDNAGGKLVIFGLTPSVSRVLKMMRIEKVMSIAADQDEAMTAVKGGK